MNLHVEIRGIFKKHVHFYDIHNYDILAALVMMSHAYAIDDHPPVYLVGPRESGKTITREIIAILTHSRLKTTEHFVNDIKEEWRESGILFFTEHRMNYRMHYTEFNRPEAQFLESSELLRKLSKIHG